MDIVLPELGPKRTAARSPARGASFHASPGAREASFSMSDTGGRTIKAAILGVNTAWVN
jgi:hypothetical protein